MWDRLIAMATDHDVRVRADVLRTLCDGSPRSREAEIAGALEQMQHEPRPQTTPQGPPDARALPGRRQPQYSVNHNSRESLQFSVRARHEMSRPFMPLSVDVSPDSV